MPSGDLDRLVDDAAASAVAVDELLRRLKVVATRARIAELETWVQRELDGYGPDEELPPYRGPFESHVLGFFAGPFQSQIRNAPIPPSSYPSEYRPGLFETVFTQGVAELEALSNSSKSLQIPWPADALLLTQVLQREGRVNFNGNVLHEAHKVVSSSQAVSILRTVRDRILALALRLEQESPSLGETRAETAAPSVGRDISIIVHGGQPNIAVASSSFSQASSVTSGDREGLAAALRSIGIGDAEIDELNRAIDDDAADFAQSGESGPGSRVLAWLGKLSLVAGASAGSTLATEAGAAVSHFFH